MNEVNYQYINLQSIKEETFGNTSILKEIMLLFVGLIDEYTQTLNEELKHKNWQILFVATHKIKPNISMFGIHELEPIIHQLDSNFRFETNLENIDDLVSISLDILKRVKEEIQTELKLMNNE